MMDQPIGRSLPGAEEREKNEIAARVAELYYVAGQKKREIAKRLALADYRAVNRYLEYAKETGIVTIHIDPMAAKAPISQPRRDEELEYELRTLFGLDGAVAHIDVKRLPRIAAFNRGGRIRKFRHGAQGFFILGHKFSSMGDLFVRYCVLFYSFWIFDAPSALCWWLYSKPTLPSQSATVPSSTSTMARASLGQALTHCPQATHLKGTVCSVSKCMTP